MPNPRRVFISFDYEHDNDRKEWLVSQLKLLGFEKQWIDESIKHSADGRWQTEARERIARSDVVLVICGKNTHSAKGVDIEHKIARQLGKPVRFLRGRVEGTAFPPDVAAADKVFVEMNPTEVGRAIGVSSAGRPQ